MADWIADPVSKPGAGCGGDFAVTLSAQHFLYFLPLPQGQGWLRLGFILISGDAVSCKCCSGDFLLFRCRMQYIVSFSYIIPECR